MDVFNDQNLQEKPEESQVTYEVVEWDQQNQTNRQTNNVALSIACRLI